MTDRVLSWRGYLIIAVLAVMIGGGIASGIPGPTYTDAYYYFNAGQRLASGQGLTDPYIALTYIGAPDRLPAPAHTYWMPLPSLIVALAGGKFRLAQAIFVGLWAGLAVFAAHLGAELGGTRRHAIGAGLLVIFSGFYAPFLPMPETFTLFGLSGAFSLWFMGRAATQGSLKAYGLAGVCAGLAHLTRADGALLIAVLVLVALWRGRSGLRGVLIGVAGYLVVMSPWLVRNMLVMGTPLPVGGTATIWLRGYNELVSYPPAMSLQNFLAWGIGPILASRWEALTNNLGTFVAVEGWVVLAPLMVVALAKRWRETRLLPVWTYALLLHLAMTLAFAYPGYRGGLFHSATALLPWWAALGLVGLDDVVGWVARRRRTWNPRQASRVFTVGVLAIAVVLTVSSVAGRWGRSDRTFYATLAETLPADAVVMSNDPAALYYHTGLPGIVTPEAAPDALRELLARYAVTHVVLDQNRTTALDAVYRGAVQYPFLQALPVPETLPDVRLFAVVLDDDG
ncbi:MAG: hypothetical protein Kow0077_10310 [Anaerolineae bacterium]